MKTLFSITGMLLFGAIVLQAQIKTIQGELPSFEVIGRTKPDTVIGSKDWMIRDFEFQDEFILALTWDRSPNKCHLRKFDFNQRQVADLELIETPYAFFKDVFGEVFLITHEHVYYIGKDSLDLVPMREDFFFGRIYPVVQRCDSDLYYSTYVRKRPEFNYLNKALDTLHEIRNKHLYDLYYSEYTFLPFHLKAEIRRRCSRSGESKYDVAAEITGFTNSLWWEELYSPLFIKNDSIYVADHYRDSLFVYDKDGKPIVSYSMHFHKQKGYKKEIICDELTGEWFARYQLNGRTLLQPVKTNAEIAQSALKLHYKYVEKVKVYNGKAWYLYRPFESNQNTFLYAEIIH